MNLYPHQKKFLDDNPQAALLAFEVGTGKTLCATEWLKLRQDMRALVIVPKNIKGKWQKDLTASGITHADLVTKEEFKKIDTSKYAAVVVDEAHHFAAPLFSQGRSQLAMKLYDMIRANNIYNVLLLTATPIRSKPENIHTLLCFLRVYIPWREFRSRFFHLVNRPYLPRPAWEPVPNWRKLARALVEKYAYSARMSDIIEDMPMQHEEVVECSSTEVDDARDDVSDENPMREWVQRHRIQNGYHKVAYIKDIASGFSKVIVVCHYRDQMEMYAKELGKEREVFQLHGDTQDATAVISAAQESSECYFIIQAGCGAGFDADTFSCMIFASMSFRYLDLVQMRGRINRIHNLHQNWYYYLIGGKEDERVHEIVMSGRDFDINIDT